MQCEEFETRLNDLLDERRQPRFDVELSRHSLRCTRCADLLCAYDTLFQGLSALPLLEIESDFPEQVVARAQSRRITTGLARHFTSNWRRLATIAAAMLIAALPAWWMGRNAAQPDADRSAVPAMLVAGPGGNGTSYVDSGSDVVASNSLATSIPSDYEELLRRRAAEMAGRQLTVAGELADGLKPVANSMSAAIDALRRSLPRAEANRSDKSAAMPETNLVG